jgi:hypothetical protein
MKIKQLSELTPLIDGDILVYRCGFAADGQLKRELKEERPDWSAEEIKAEMDKIDYLDFALGNVKTTINDVLTSRFNTDRYRLFLTGVGNYREQIATILPYKGNRDPDYKPKYYKEIKQYLRDVWNAETIDGREADDALGCAQWAAKDRSTIIVSIDKDLDQIPGNHYNWVKQEFYTVSLEMANLMLFRQMLTGDRVDNIPGIDGIGDVRAEKLLAAHSYQLEPVREAVKNCYRNQYGENWEQAYLEVGSLLWIQRVEDKPCPFL